MLHRREITLLKVPKWFTYTGCTRKVSTCQLMST